MVLSCSLANPRPTTRKREFSEPSQDSYRTVQKDFEKLRVRLALSQSSILFLVEAQDSRRNTWLLLCSGDLADGHRGVFEYWKAHKNSGMPEDITPLTGCVVKLTEEGPRCGGFSGTYKMKMPNFRAYSDILSKILKPF